MSRRGSSAIVANPVLVGAVTALVVVVAVFLAYNANNGLPFVPTYDLKTVVPSAANLVTGNEVRIGGSRVGVIDRIRAVRRPDGSAAAQLSLKLDTAVQPLPRDSTVLVRPRSALGLKYLQISKGASAAGLPDGGTLPIGNARPLPVDIDDVLSMFDEPTRAASRTNLDELGTALGGRGSALNGALAAFPVLLPNLESTMRTLRDRRTDLPGFFRGLGRAAAEAAPVAEAQAALFRDLDTTFGALADARRGIQASIATGPAALDAGIRGFPVQRPFLAHSAALFRELRPGVRALRLSAADLADAFTIGQPVLRDSVALNRRLEPTFRAVQRFAEDPRSALGIDGLRTTAQIADPTLRYATPAQSRCNYLTLLLRNAASLLSEGDANGTWQRFVIVASPPGPNNEGGPSSAPANGGGPMPRLNHLHANPYPNTAAPSQPGECEAGNEDYAAGRTSIGSERGAQGLATERTRLRRDPMLRGLPLQPGRNEKAAQLAPQPAGGSR